MYSHLFNVDEIIIINYRIHPEYPWTQTLNTVFTYNLSFSPLLYGELLSSPRPVQPMVSNSCVLFDTVIDYFQPIPNKNFPMTNQLKLFQWISGN